MLTKSRAKDSPCLRTGHRGITLSAAGPSAPGSPQPLEVNVKDDKPLEIAGDQADLRQVYAAVAQRRTNLAQMTWQAPSLAIAAQAFLLVRAVAGGDRRVEVGAASLAIAASFATVQLMTKHRLGEIADTMLLRAIEAHLGIRLGPVDDPVYPHSHPNERYRLLGLQMTGFDRLMNWFVSGYVWISLASLFFVVGIGVLIGLLAGVLP
jgi:hypothetical protein